MFQKNIKILLKKHTLLFIMLILTQVIAVCAILFSYGIYSDSRYSYNSSNDVLYDIDIYTADKENDSIKIVKEIFPEVLQDFEEDLRSVEIWTEGTFDTPVHKDELTAGIKDLSDDYIYTTNLVSYFTIENGKYKHCPDTKRLMAESTEGEWISEEELNSDEHVCVLGNNYINAFDSEVTINGVEYRIKIKAGIRGGFDNQIAVPLQAMPDSVNLSLVFITFNKPIVKSRYDELVERFEDALGTDIIVDDFCSASLDEVETYRTMMVIAIIMALIASFIVCLIYRNILERRIHATGIYLICGSTRLSAALVYIKEMALILAATAAAGVVIYLKCIMPKIAVYFTYFDDIYSKSITYKLPALYLLIVFTVSALMIAVKMRKTPMQIIKDLRK